MADRMKWKMCEIQGILKLRCLKLGSESCHVQCRNFDPMRSTGMLINRDNIPTAKYGNFMQQVTTHVAWKFWRGLTSKWFITTTDFHQCGGDSG